MLPVPPQIGSPLERDNHIPHHPHPNAVLEDDIDMASQGSKPRNLRVNTGSGPSRKQPPTRRPTPVEEPSPNSTPPQPETHARDPLLAKTLQGISDQLEALRIAHANPPTNVDTPPVVPTPKARTKAPAKPRTALNYAQMVYLKSDIRRFTKSLLGLPERSLACPPSEAIETFKAHRRQGPTAESFTMDYLGPPGSPWNQEASQVFRDAFLVHPGHEHYEREGPMIRYQFLQHFVNTLKLNYEKEHPKKSEEEVKEREDRKRVRSSRDGRRYRLYQRRLKTCLFVVALQRFVPLLQSLGYEGMSEDESGTEAVHTPHDVPRITNDGQKGYAILRSIWRNDDVIMPILRVIDQITISRKFSANGRPQKGNWPHVRIPTSRFSERKHLAERPLILYRPSYLSCLTEHQREDLRIVPLLLEIPPIPEDVKREAKRFEHVRSSLDRPLPSTQ
ncbi:hypothetical protein SISNIDRAFT_492068 [Sistotremastrum niveocremeum HHB9708]|nr:hypothetical protein SISNIDRAFT_492068 [Sistotremastrum niveocremeum HHB9708]